MTLIAALKYLLHLAPVVSFLLGYWMTGVTLSVFAFIFYVKTFKLEVYKKDLEEQGTLSEGFSEELQKSIVRWKQFTFINEYRGHNDSERPDKK